MRNCHKRSHNRLTLMLPCSMDSLPKSRWPNVRLFVSTPVVSMGVRGGGEGACAPLYIDVCKI